MMLGVRERVRLRGGGVGVEGRGSWKRGGGCPVVSGGSGNERIVGVGMAQIEEVLDRCLHWSGVRSALGLKKLSSELARLCFGGELG